MRAPAIGTAKAQGSGVEARLGWRLRGTWPRAKEGKRPTWPPLCARNDGDEPKSRARDDCPLALRCCRAVALAATLACSAQSNSTLNSPFWPRATHEAPSPLSPACRPRKRACAVDGHGQEMGMACFPRRPQSLLLGAGSTHARTPPRRVHLHVTRSAKAASKATTPPWDAWHATACGDAAAVSRPPSPYRALACRLDAQAGAEP